MFDEAGFVECFVQPFFFWDENINKWKISWKVLILFV